MDNIEQLQTEYLEALNSGNADRKRELEGKIDAFLSQGEQPQAPPPAPEVAPEPIVAEAQGIQEQGEAQAEPAPNTDVAPASGFDEDTTKWLDSLDKSIRPHIEAKLNADKKELLIEWYKTQQQFQAVNGRVAAYQRRYEDIQKKAVQQEEMLKKLTSTTAQPQGNPAATKTVAIDEDPDLKAIAETDEQLARVIAKREQLLRAEIEGLKSTMKSELEPLRRSNEEQVIQSELNRLTQMVPNAIEIFNHPAWDNWLNFQPPGVRALATSSNADDVVHALRLYGDDIKRYSGESQPVQAEAKPDPKATQVAAERERKLQAQPVGSASVRPPQKTQPTFEEIAANPELLEKYQQQILQEELKKRAGA